jgi:hypothetical protein
VGAKEQSGRTLVFSLPGSRDIRAYIFNDALILSVAVYEKSTFRFFIGTNIFKDNL